MPEPSSSAVGDGALPESTSTDAPKNLPARRFRKRRNSEIATATVDAIPSPPRQPSVETTTAPVRATRAFAAATRPAPADGPYVRRYAKKSEIVTESTLPKFTMPTSTFDPDTIVLQYTGQAKVGMQPVNSTRGKEQTGDLSRNVGVHVEVGPPRPQTRNSRGKARKHVSDSSEEEDVIQAKNKKGNARPKAGNDSSAPVERLAGLSNASQGAPSALPLATGHEASESSEDERRLLGQRVQVGLDLEPFSESFREPYASTFFTPQLDDYDLPASVRAPPLYYHTELPSHPPVPDRSLSTPVSLMTGIIDMSVQTTIHTPNELVDAEIAKLLEPMTDTEGEGDDDATLATESDSDSQNASDSIVRFPRDATEEIATQYAALKRVLKASLEQQKEVQEKLDAGLEDQKKMVKAQEDFEKAEQWGERSGPARWAGTRSRGGMTADGPDFLDYLRAKAKEDQ